MGRLSRHVGTIFAEGNLLAEYYTDRDRASSGQISKPLLLLCFSFVKLLHTVMKISDRCNFHFRKFFAILALGQLLSWLVCGTGVFSQLLVTNYNIEIPTTQSFLNYLLLGFVYTTALACHPRDFKTRLKETGWKYFLLALCDVEANYLVVKAYQYTNLTSIQVSQ